MNVQVTDTSFYPLKGDESQGVLNIMAYTWRLRPKEVPFSGLRYIKG